MLLLMTLSLLQSPALDTIALRPGLVLTRSTVVRPGVYRLAPAEGDSAVIRIRGDGVTLDLNGATLLGGPPEAAPDQRRGIAILIEGGREISVRNGRIHGYRIAVLARGTTGLSLLDNDVSRNWAARLWSGPGHESLADWLYFHHNENDEWLRYAAALYLSDVRGGTIRGNTARHGMNGLLLVRSDSLRIYNNVFSFLSGLGVGLYRSSHNAIMHNRLDYCVRGYVHGVYRRGQDSSGLLLYEQSAGNVVAYNSMTHGGDGVFLWAGQSTMESGQGGANDNLFFGNDVSFAVANGVEATFSRNRIIGNLSEGSEYGVWGGYSWETVIRGNRFVDNVTGVAIEHGQENRIEENVFERDRTAVRIWANPSQPSDWGYPRNRDTRSRDYAIRGNTFLDNRVGIRGARTEGVTLAANLFVRVDSGIVASVDTSGWRRVSSEAGPTSALVPVRQWRPDTTDGEAPAALPGGIQPWLPPGAVRGRQTILVDQWGPYDWGAPRAWPLLADSAWSGGPLRLSVIGPPGRWRVSGRRGVLSLFPEAGAVGDTLVVTPTAGRVADLEIELEYVGEEVRPVGGPVVAAGQPYRFRYQRFAAAPDWRVQVFTWDSAGDPRTREAAFRRTLATQPVLERSERRLDWMWSRPRIEGMPAERFAVTAEGAVELPPGDYELIAISDDGIRVWVDGALAIDRWEPHESVVDRVPLSAGRHQLRLEYYQVGGWVELRVEVRKR